LKTIVKTTGFFLGMVLIVLSGFAPQSRAALFGEVYSFDFDSDYVLNSGPTGIIYTQSGFTQVLPDHLYGEGNWFGWSADLSPGRDRWAIIGDDQSNLHRDLHFSSTPQTFSVDLDNGDYTVTLHFCDTAWLHNNLEVQAEGSVVLADVDVPKGATPVIATFTVTVIDGTLDLQFSDPVIDSDPNWIINGAEIALIPPSSSQIPLPASVLLLGSGLLGLGLLGRRRKKS
jgi:hypothetical protein